MKKNLAVLFLLCALSVLAACGGGSDVITTPPPALTITSAAPPSGKAGSAYAGNGFLLTASGGKAPYSWNWTPTTGSALPPGLTLSDGMISGTPTEANTYNVVITVTDSQSPASQKSAAYAITIAPPTSGSPPSINTIPSPNVGAINLPYHFAFTTSGGVSPFSWSETGALPPGLALGTDGSLAGTPTALGSFPITVMVSDSLGLSATPQNFTIVVAAHGFKVTGSMAVPRGQHSATLLQDGRVLVAGGVGYVSGHYSNTATAELYDPALGTFSRTGSMNSARHCHTATLLTNGQVLVTGGYDGSTSLSTAEIFDPVSGTFAPTGNMAAARCGHTATLLANGKVLIAGGEDTNAGIALASAELFDPATGAFSATGSMGTARAAHSATLLSSGRVLVTGGGNGNPIATAELYDPISGTFSPTGDMATARESHTATLLTTGRVLITGGAAVLTAEIFDPAGGSFTSTGSMADARLYHTATLLSDGTVLVAGGSGPARLSSAEVFDPATGTFSLTGSMTIARTGHTATLLNDGTVLAVGGLFGRFPLGAGSTAELYQ
jgi:Putative Ig domain/Kelch motif/Galactose oxidase, central domain